MNKKTQLRKRADRAWFTKNLKPICECCGKPSVQVHHFFPKGRFGHLRYNDDNAISLCQGCHFSHHHAGDPTIHQTIIKKRGQNWYNNLLIESKERPQSYQTIAYYNQIIQESSL